jgi:hypothetical protein
VKQLVDRRPAEARHERRGEGDDRVEIALGYTFKATTMLAEIVVPRSDSMRAVRSACYARPSCASAFGR